MAIVLTINKFKPFFQTDFTAWVSLLQTSPHQCANIGPADYNYDETISTLRYANRAKNIKNKARINEDPKDALLRQFQKEIEELKKKLEEGNETDMFCLIQHMYHLLYKPLVQI